MKHITQLFCCLILCMLSLLTAHAADFIWLEGEKPTTKNIEASLTGWGNAQFLSNNAWLSLSVGEADIEKKVPKEGAIFSYDFSAAAPGNYAVWGRIGFEDARSPFDWRIDQGDWKTVKPSDPTCDLMEIVGWNQMGWLTFGRVDLAAGNHTLTIRMLQVGADGKRVGKGIFFGLDAVCMTKDPFQPNSKYKPDESWQTDKDKVAAAYIFDWKAADTKSMERIEFPLAGQWQVARYDEQVVVDRDGPTKTLPDLAQANWMAITVPSNKFTSKPDLKLCHRLLYRTRIKVPAELAGHSFFFRFPANSLISSLIVNGQYCGFSKTPFALWECDATAAMKPGQINEICVVLKDNYYAITPTKSPGGCRAAFHIPLEQFTQSWVWAKFDFPIGAGIFDISGSSGILLTPSLVAAGPVYTSDLFAIPSVKKKKLGKA